MLGEKALELVKDAARNENNLNPFSEDLVRATIEETRRLWEQNRFVSERICSGPHRLVCLQVGGGGDWSGGPQHDPEALGHREEQAVSAGLPQPQDGPHHRHEVAVRGSPARGGEAQHVRARAGVLQ